MPGPATATCRPILSSPASCCVRSARDRCTRPPRPTARRCGPPGTSFLGRLWPGPDRPRTGSELCRDVAGGEVGPCGGQEHEHIDRLDAEPALDVVPQDRLPEEVD